MKSLVVAALLVPTVAHAEYIAPRPAPEVRPIQTKSTKPERIAPRVALARQEASPAVARRLEVDDVLAKINGPYMAGLQRCYTRSVAHDPYVARKVNLSFTVTPEGRVVAAMAGDALERCIGSLMSRWQFGVSVNDRGEPVEASFRIAVVMQGG